MRIFLIAIVSLLAACARPSELSLLQRQGILTVDASLGKRADYVVSIRDPKQTGYDPDDPEARDTVATIVLNGLCPAGRVVGETVVTSGDPPPDHAVRSYSVRVKC